MGLDIESILERVLVALKHVNIDLADASWTRNKDSES